MENKPNRPFANINQDNIIEELLSELNKNMDKILSFSG